MRLKSLIFALALVALLDWSTIASAQGLDSLSEWTEFHKGDVGRVSKNSGLSVITVENLLHAVDRDGGEEDQYFIQRIDVSALKQRGHVLLALTDFGTSHALEVSVIDVKSPNYFKVWSTREIPEWKACPSMDLSTESVLGEATAFANTAGEIVVEIPVREKMRKLVVAKFSWSGKTYKLASVREFLRYDSNKRDWRPQGGGRVRECRQE